jgi:hypothetical protein
VTRLFAQLTALLICAPPCFSATPESVIAERARCDEQFSVRIGNDGKDVIWVPTHDRLVTAMLDAANAGRADHVIDLGAGDGKIPIAAAKEFGSSALGVEFDPRMVQLAKCYVDAEDLSGRVEIRQADIFATDISKATIVTLYLLPKLNMKLRPALLKLEPGTRIVSNRFKLGSWEPDRVISVEGVANQAYLWYVPASIAGMWRFESTTGTDRFRIRFSQTFQRVEATGPGRRRIRDLELRGGNVEFTLRTARGELRLQGRLINDELHLESQSKDERISYVGRKD